MIAHLSGIAQKEGAELSEEALALITRAAEGSVRDALSLMDQAIAHGGGTADAETVRAMLGLADRGRVLDLFDKIMHGDAAGALAELSEQYARGADPMAVLRDIAEITHWISVLKLTPEAPTIGPEERDRGRDLAAGLSQRVLSRMWQMCLKALEEVAMAPSPMMAAEMAVIRMTHVSDLPTPGDLVRKLTAEPPARGGGSAGQAAAPAGAPAGAPRATAVRSVAGGGSAPMAQADPAQALARYERFEDVVALIRARRDVRLLVEVEAGVRLVKYTPGRIEFEPTESAPPDLAARLGRQLQGWTGQRWAVSVVSEGGGPTIAETRAAERDDMIGQAMRHPMLQAVIAAFPGVTDDAIQIHQPVEMDSVAPPPEEPDEDGEEWDPLDSFD